MSNTPIPESEETPIGATARKGQTPPAPSEFAQSVRTVADRELRKNLRETAQQAKAQRRK